MKSMSKLKKLKMPEKKGEDMEGMEMVHEGMEDSPELAAAEEEYGMDLDNDKEAGEPAEHAEKVLSGELDAISDEDLMAEIQKRGLMSKLQNEEVDEEEMV